MVSWLVTMPTTARLAPMVVSDDASEVPAPVALQAADAV
jgi:hypothetical protein